MSSSDHHLVTNPSDLSILLRGTCGSRRCLKAQPARPRAGRCPAELGTQHQLPSPSWSQRCGPAQERWFFGGGPLTGVQSYSLHALEDLYHTQGTTPAPYPFTFMTMSSDPPPVGPFSPDEGADTSLPSRTLLHGPKMMGTWRGAYECRRAY